MILYSLLLEYTTSLTDYANVIPRYYVTVLCVTGEPTLTKKLNTKYAKYIIIKVVGSCSF
jgi:hypothetical protein